MNYLVIYLLLIVIVPFTITSLVIYHFTKGPKILFVLKIVWIFLILFFVAIKIGMSRRNMFANEKKEVLNYLVDKFGDNNYTVVSAYAYNQQYTGLDNIFTDYRAWDWKDKAVLLQDDKGNDILYSDEWLNGQAWRKVVKYKDIVYTYSYGGQKNYTIDCFLNINKDRCKDLFKVR